MMAIPEKEYIELKEYWDFQRKKEYNKEKVIKMCESFGGRLYDQFGQVPLQEIKDTIWTRIPQSEYEEPPKDWVPEDPTYRLWNEWKEAWQFMKIVYNRTQRRRNYEWFFKRYNQRNR